MAPDTVTAGGSIGARITALRDRWHTKNHPFFQALANGTLELDAMGVYMAHHFKFVAYALPAFGLLYYRAPTDVRNSLVENMSEEAGLKAIPVAGHVPHDHNEMIFRFCAAAGVSEQEVKGTVLSPAWLARALHYVHCLREEPLGVALAMQSTQEGQQVALNNEVTIPAFTTHYGFAHDAPEIGFFVEHAEADLEHSNRQLSLCEKYLDTPELEARALEVADVAVRLRWESITYLHRRFVLHEPELLPAGVDG
jgi:pyrroloquinoline quinone (PQQ) biosynthesis protein C